MLINSNYRFQTSEICDSPVKSSGFTIHNATQVQQPIISMEDEDMSDQEMVHIISIII